MPTRPDLKWMTKLTQFDNNEQLVLTELSDDKYKWRTRERLSTLTGMDSSIIDEVLSQLISKGIVRLSKSKKKNIIFGIREIVD